MPKKKDAIWKQVTMKDGDKTKCSCNHCSKEIGASVRTIRSHMLSCPRISQINRVSAERSILTATQKRKSRITRRLDNFDTILCYNSNSNTNSNTNSNSNSNTNSNTNTNTNTDFDLSLPLSTNTNANSKNHSQH